MFIIILVSLNTFSIPAKLISEINVQYDYLTIMALFQKTTIQLRGFFYLWLLTYENQVRYVRIPLLPA